MERIGAYAVVDPATVDAIAGEPVPQVVVDLDELRRMRGDVIAIRATVDHLLEALTALIGAARPPADRS